MHCVQNKRSYSISIAKFLACLICNIDSHLHKKPYLCSKHHPAQYNCKLCSHKSYANTNQYQCIKCRSCFCVIHLIRHIQLFAPKTIHQLHVWCTSKCIDIGQQFFIPQHILFKLAINLINTSIKIKVVNKAVIPITLIPIFFKAENISEISDH